MVLVFDMALLGILVVDCPLTQRTSLRNGVLSACRRLDRRGHRTVQSLKENHAASNDLWEEAIGATLSFMSELS